MIILGIETSCDETAVSVVRAEGDLNNPRFEILGSSINSQIDIHKEYGGVFPSLAKREHIKNLPLVYKDAFDKSKINELQIEKIFVTVGPGLEPALWTGINFAGELGKRLKIPVIGTNHMLGHIASVLFKTEENPKSEIRNPKNLEFPAVALLISGGHTELILIKSWTDMQKLGETQDDAVGEAFDKVARMMGLPYPGGPKISALAEKARNSNIEIQNIKFPRPMIHSKDFNFSFSGLKTAVLYYIKKLERLEEKEKMEIAREFEDAVIETLISKTRKAMSEHSPKTLIIGGGVIANKSLRENFLNISKSYPQIKILIPEKTLTTDNATMIAAAGYIEYLCGKQNKKLRADGNLPIN